MAKERKTKRMEVVSPTTGRNITVEGKPWIQPGKHVVPARSTSLPVDKETIDTVGTYALAVGLGALAMGATRSLQISKSTAALVLREGRRGRGPTLKRTVKQYTKDPKTGETTIGPKTNLGNPAMRDITTAVEATLKKRASKGK